MTKLNQIPIPELFVSPEAAEKLADEGAKLPGWTLSARQIRDLELLMNGGFFPLKGFLTQADCESVSQEMRLTSGACWPLPLTLRVDEGFAARIEPGDDIGLQDDRGDLLAIMSVTDHWAAGTDTGTNCLGGKVKGLRPPAGAGTAPNHMRSLFRANGWDRVAALHDIETLPGPENGMALMLMPLIGQIPASERAGMLQRCESMIAGRADTCIAPIDLPMREPGPQISILQALVARNYGATHVFADDDPPTRQALEEAGLILLSR
ncbi:hypothetical protein [Paracoccus methylarcula]|uniref:Sulfate adenylyltransferase n=1 Tax=Paracoccus methylarcula TaxID=72022 RepID=A0A3R7MAE1_9RHOB|nr:hypothetical protein [Paracoccus methylarcula]RNF35585.1 hypothetical protein A7A09_004000 [Paracoccus methylarcula]